jgi:uncharacterized protein (DUF486 family)
MWCILMTVGLLLTSNIFLWFLPIGYTVLSLAQLKIVQEVSTLAVFTLFSIIFMKQPFRLDFIWAALCLMGAVYFIFRPA